jgi:hypothetical protein
VTPEEIALVRHHKAEILALLRRQADPAPVGETPRTVTTETTKWAARGGRDGRTGLPRGWSPARFRDAALSSFGFDDYWTPWEAIAHAIGLGHARAWCWIQLTQLEDAGLLERGGDGGAQDPWRFCRLVETSSPPSEGTAPVLALSTAQLRAPLAQQGVRAWRFPWPVTLNGTERQIGQLASCMTCGRATFVRYETASCLPCAIQAAAAPAVEVTPPDGRADELDWEQT